MKKKTDAHYRQFRRHTHLAGVDIEVMEYEGKSLVFEIEQAYYSPDENVNGRVTECYVMRFKGIEKPMVINSKNRDTIRQLAINTGMSSHDANIVGNWVGMKIQLYFDASVKFHSKVTGGIRVSPKIPVEKKKPEFTHDNFEKALQANATIEFIKKHYSISIEIENEYLELLTKTKEEE